MIVYPSGEEEFTSPGMFSALRTLIRGTEQIIRPDTLAGKDAETKRPTEQDAE